MERKGHDKHLRKSILILNHLTFFQLHRPNESRYHRFFGNSLTLKLFVVSYSFMQLLISLTVYSTAESAQCLAMLTCASADLHVIPSSSSLPNVSNSTQGRDDPDDLFKYSFMNKILVIPLSYCIKI